MQKNSREEKLTVLKPVPVLAGAHPRTTTVFLWLTTILIVLVCLLRFVEFPSFWLDEAFVAASLRDPSPANLFDVLAHKQLFPRLYLSLIALLREGFGYRIGIIRLLPFLCFALATALWARLLNRRAAGSLFISLLGASLLIGSVDWMAQAVQLKQYTFDVLLALMPFCVNDDLFVDSFAAGKHKKRLLLLVLPCTLSYVYPIALGSRVLGWYIYRGRRQGWRLQKSTALLFGLTIMLGLVSLWLTDLQFNLQVQDSYVTYWRDCILRFRLSDGIGSGLRLLADFFWGWYRGRRMYLVIGLIAALQVLGVYNITRQWRVATADDRPDQWGARGLGSLMVLGSVILASLLVSYPICHGRLTLFAQVHTQLLALEGAAFLFGRCGGRRITVALACVCVIGVGVFSARQFNGFIKTPPPENIALMIPLIRNDLASTVWVHPCSVVQVQSLPEPLLVDHVKLSRRKDFPENGQTVWILWTNLADDFCREWLDKVHAQARSWQIVDEGFGRGLVLAQF